MGPGAQNPWRETGASKMAIEVEAGRFGFIQGKAEPAYRMGKALPVGKLNSAIKS